MGFTLKPEDLYVDEPSVKYQETDALIIGAGPAGISAAIQLQRSGCDLLLVEKDRIGGALLNAGWVENYPGIAGGVTGAELVNRFQDHLRRLAIPVHFSDIEKLSRSGNWFVASHHQSEIRSKAVIIATGCVPRRMGIPGEADLSGSRIFYERRDIPDDFAGKICIIGGGDAAFDYALSSADRGMEIVICIRSQPRCLPLLQDRAAAHESIHLTMAGEPVSFQPASSSGVIVRTQRTAPIHCDLVLVAIGREPADDFLEPALRKTASTDPLLHFAGDVVNGGFRQVGIAVGDGLRSAMDIAHKLTPSVRQ